MKLPKRRRTAVVTDDDDDDDDDAPKAESSRSKTRSKGKGKEKERVEEEKEEESEEEEEEGEGPAESERTRLRPKGRWAKLEAELRGLDVCELLVPSVVETAQLRVALADADAQRRRGLEGVAHGPRRARGRRARCRPRLSAYGVYADGEAWHVRYDTRYARCEGCCVT